MTLIAGYRPSGVPILLGDFLVTGGGQISSGKKIIKISPNFVIGWTGKKFIARSVLQELQNNFGNKNVSVSQVENLLTRYSQSDFGDHEMHLIGWIIDGEPYCFRWNNQYPSELFSAPFHFGGSGAETFQKMFETDYSSLVFGTRRSNIDQAIYTSLSRACELISDEVLDRLNRQQGFGYAYELLYFDGAQFQYLDNVLYLGADALWNPEREFGNYRFYSVAYQYHNLLNHSVVRILDSQTKSQKIDLIHPPFTPPPEDTSIEFEPASLNADYYCLFLRLATPDGLNIKSSIVLPGTEENKAIYIKKMEEGQAFTLPQHLLKALYEQSKVVQEHNQQHKIRYGWGAAETVQIIERAGSSFEFSSGRTDKCAVAGLVNSSGWNQNYDTMNYAIMFCPDGTIQIYEKGLAVGPFGKTYTVNDLFRIGVFEVGGELAVLYFQNGELLYKSDTLPILPLRLGASLRDEGAKISAPKFYR